MPLLTKQVLPANTYKVRSGGQRVSKQFDEVYLRKIAETTNKMITAGLKIPAPFDHHKDARPLTEKEIDENKGSSSFNNAGYWTSFWVAPDSKGVPTLYGQADISGDVSDPNSPAYKAMNTAKEVSISLANNFEDGIGRTWTDGLVHVALVTHAVVPDQEPFQDNTTVVNMSMIEMSSHEGDNTSIIEELKAALKKVKINLPGSTNPDSFLRDLLVAVEQIGSNDQSQLEPAPIYMSIGDNMPLSKEQAEALVATKTVNPATKLPFTMDDLGFQVKPPTKVVDMSNIDKLLEEKDKAIEGLKGMVLAIKNKFQAEKQQSVQARISALLKKGVISKEYADTVLNPKVTFEMSLTNMEAHPLDIPLSALESLPVKGVPNLDLGNIADNPGVEGTQMSEEQMEAALKAFEADGLL